VRSETELGNEGIFLLLILILILGADVNVRQDHEHDQDQEQEHVGASLGHADWPETNEPPETREFELRLFFRRVVVPD
jgi:hypothetical protein